MNKEDRTWRRRTGRADVADMTRDDLMLMRFVVENPEWREMYAEGDWQEIESLLAYKGWRLSAEFSDLWSSLSAEARATWARLRGRHG